MGSALDAHHFSKLHKRIAAGTIDIARALLQLQLAPHPMVVNQAQTLYRISVKQKT